ncbi:amidase domain-containing protein [Agromyces sp. LHK192]|uniref:amidase domain-containing protein n=1 Tax=Agromyces sp. LHK192 TaxID=2498704 RepID=UPI000FDC1029|nr:amidase domain-containing protein [Agromyces sp. LHK192]
MSHHLDSPTDPESRPSGEAVADGVAPSRGSSVLRRRRLLVGGVAGLLLLGGAATAIVAASDSGGTDAPRVAAAEDVTDASGTAVSPADTTAADKSSFASLSPAVAAQMSYVLANWQSTEHDVFGYMTETDCVNFASQSLLERGWTTDDEWWYAEGGDPYAHSTAWISSTAFMEWLGEHPERATALTDDQRDLVKVGDIVQFDWDDSGDRDHTGIVTAVETRDDGTISIEYAGHTDATWDRTVDEAITQIHPGGVAYYWSIPE